MIWKRALVIAVPKPNKALGSKELFPYISVVFSPEVPKILYGLPYWVDFPRPTKTDSVTQLVVMTYRLRITYPLYTALLDNLIALGFASDWHVSDSSPLAYLCERTCKLKLGVLTLQGTQRFASCAWPVVLWKLGNRLKWKGESWFHYRELLFAGVLRIAETWFYLV